MKKKAASNHDFPGKVFADAQKEVTRRFKAGDKELPLVTVPTDLLDVVAALVSDMQFDTFEHVGRIQRALTTALQAVCDEITASEVAV